MLSEVKSDRKTGSETAFDCNPSTKPTHTETGEVGQERQTGVLDRTTDDKPHGPWPAASHKSLAAWIKLEGLEYRGTKHESEISVIRDSAKHGGMVVIAPYDIGVTKVMVEIYGELDIKDASEASPVSLVVEGTSSMIQATRLIFHGHSAAELSILPPTFAGKKGQRLLPATSDVHQIDNEHQPIYRRNICNFMPSIRFAPDQFLAFQDHSVLARRLSGPVESVDFTLFFVTKAYASVGSSPWPVFTALDSESGWSYQVQVVIEQRAGISHSFESRLKVQFGKYSEKTEGVDPTQFHIVMILKKGRLVRLFIDGCNDGKPHAEFVIEEEGQAKITCLLFGLDANGSKYFDGEIAEFLAYSAVLQPGQTNSIGKYLSRRYGLIWSWKEPNEQRILDEYMFHRNAKTNPSRIAQLAASAFGRNKILAKSQRKPHQQYKLLVECLSIPEEAMNSMERLAQLAKDPQAQEAILNEDPWDALFSYLESNQTPLKSLAVRSIHSLVKGNDTARAEVMRRDGLYLFLKAAEPPWRLGLKRLLNEKMELVVKAKQFKIQLEEDLTEADETDIVRTFQLRLQIRQSFDRIHEAQAQVEDVRHRLDSGIEKNSNLKLQREALHLVAALCETAPARMLLVDLSGLLVLSRVLTSESLPVKSSVCQVISALVVDREMATELLRQGLMADVVDLMGLDDPHLQCEAAQVLLLSLQHVSLRSELATDELFQALFAMIDNEYEDCYLASVRIIHVLSAHDTVLRERVASFPGMLDRIMAVSLLDHIEIRQRAVQAIGFLTQSKSGVEYMWDNGLEKVLRELLEDNDATVSAHILMSMANAACTHTGSRRLYEMDFMSKLCEIGSRSESAVQHLVCGVFSNLSVPIENHQGLLCYPVLPFLVNMLSESAFHARYNAAIALRKLAHSASNANLIVEAGALAPLVSMAQKPRVLVDPPVSLSISREGRSLYLHWQASRTICALTVSPDVHIRIVRAGGIIALIQLCESGRPELCREGASSLAYMAEVRCETECLLQMAEAGAIQALQALAENEDDSTGSEAIRALSSLLNFDTAWAD